MQAPLKTNKKTTSLGLGDLAHYYRRIFYVCLAVSIAAHFFSYAQLRFLSNYYDMGETASQTTSEPVRITFNESPSQAQKDLEQSQKILEVRQTETEPPDAANHLGHQNHRTERETRLPQFQQRATGADPGAAGDTQEVVNQSGSAQPDSPLEPRREPSLQITSPTGRVLLHQEKPQSEYTALLPRAHELMNQLNAGFQDYVDDDITEGDRIDINTTEYRFVGYFTHMRKAIEMVWNYPLVAARQGMQGQVYLEFSIKRDGSTDRIRVLESSGYKILDDAIVQAIRLASPFAPLPESFEKELLTVKGTFHYTLSRSLAGAH